MKELRSVFDRCDDRVFEHYALFRGLRRGSSSEVAQVSSSSGASNSEYSRSLSNSRAPRRLERRRRSNSEFSRGFSRSGAPNAELFRAISSSGASKRLEKRVLSSIFEPLGLRRGSNGEWSRAFSLASSSMLVPGWLQDVEKARKA